MRITIYIGSMAGGGAERVCCNLANFLSAHGHDVTMLLMAETKEHFSLNKNINTVFLASLSERKNKFTVNFKRYNRLKKYVELSSTDCYIVMIPITTALLLHFRKKTKATIIASERNAPTAYSKIEQALLRYYAKYADAWVFQTESAKQWYSTFIKTGTVIPNAINPEFIRPEYVGEKEKSIVAAGRLSAQKNFKLLLDAFSKVTFKHPEYRLKIFGKGPLEKGLHSYAAEKGVLDKTDFMGYVSDMPTQLEKASLFVLSSSFEGMPNVLMEAMAVGLPCVATDCPAGGPAFLIKNGENGVLIPMNDKDKMATAINTILSDHKYAETLGKNARNIAIELSPEYIYTKWEEYINKITQGATI